MKVDNRLDSLGSGAVSGSVGNAVGGSIGDSISVAIGGSVCSTVAELFPDRRISLVIVTDVKTQTSRVDTAVTPDKESTKHWLGKQVEDTVEDGFRVRGNNVTALTYTPGNWIENPKEGGKRTAH